MTLPPEDAAPPPPRRRAPWSFKNLVEDVSGRPLSDFQEPPPGSPASGTAGRAPPHRSAPGTGTRSSTASEDLPEGTVAIPAAATEPMEEPPVDPVARIYPPLSGSTARALHGADAEHHAPTLRSVERPREPLAPGNRAHRPGPSQRPERIYLHYLLLHLDRLNDAGLRYLKHAVDEEIVHRESGPGATPPSPGPAATPRVEAPEASPAPPADPTPAPEPALAPPPSP